MPDNRSCPKTPSGDLIGTTDEKAPAGSLGTAVDLSSRSQGGCGGTGPAHAVYGFRHATGWNGL